MLKQISILLALAVIALAHSDGKAFYSAKNIHQKQQHQYGSLTSYHLPLKVGAAPQIEDVPEPQVAPSPYSFGYEAEGSVVKYVADEQGFRANIDTNEAGTKSSNPSNVAVKSAFVEPPAPAHPIPQTYSVLVQQALRNIPPLCNNLLKKYATSVQHTPQTYVAPVQPAPHQYASSKTTSYSASLYKGDSQPEAAPSPYSFGYEAEGSVRQESSDGSGKVTGSYTVTNEDGSVRVVKYVADEQGFRANIDTNEAGTKSSNPSNVALKSAFVEPPAPAHPIPQTYGVLLKQTPQKYATSVQHFAPPPLCAIRHLCSTSRSEIRHLCATSSPDIHRPMHPYTKVTRNHKSHPSPYSFGYEAEGSVRQESSDGSGKVTGRYTVTNEDGSVRVVKYVADEQGFRADIDTNEAGTKSSNPSNVALKSAFVEPPAPVQPAHQIYVAPVQLAHQKYASSQAASYGGQYKQARPTLPYVFSYNAKLEDGSSSRKESADASGKVVGSYNLATADGRQRTLHYTADHEGFRASVDTPMSLEPRVIRQLISSLIPMLPTKHQYLYSTVLKHSLVRREPHLLTLLSKVVHAGSQVKSAIQSQTSYQGQKTEPVPEVNPLMHQGKVIGSYSLSEKDGRKRTVEYSAGHGGFRATVNTNEFGTKSDSPADIQFYSSAPQVEPQSPSVNGRYYKTGAEQILTGSSEVKSILVHLQDSMEHQLYSIHHLV
ncbi:hypothetical protein CEXT_524021 [Caerostris extrusa]|uniref:Cuticle protein n=1 Tax=Caerostris extrusa TaxID=172846 RepID=A0AAV4P4E1_CAEEX|nr:hypothetical protein CEXT_524021 [Caerostris extrusa]